RWNGSTSHPGVIMLNGNSSTSGYGLVYDHPTLSVLCGGVGFANANVSLQADTWYHIAAVRGNGVWKLFLNGQERSTSGNPIPNIPTDGLYIGQISTGSENFGGFIDEVRV